MKISIRKKISLAFVLFIGISALIWLRSFYSQYILNQKIEIIERKYDLLNAVLEARRYEKNYFLSFDKKNLVEALDYATKAEDILRNILTKYGKYTLAKNLDESIGALESYKESLKHLLELQEKGYLMVPPDVTDSIQKQGRIITSDLENVVKKESAFTRDLIRESRTIHLVALVPVFILSIAIALFLNFNVNRPLKTIGEAIVKIAKGDFKNIPEIHTGDEFESLVSSLNKMIGELNKRSKELVQAQKLASLGRLTSGVAHELNNPLNNISTSLQILIEELDDGDLEYQKELLTNAEKEVERSKLIIRSLLEFTRERTLTLELVNFKDLVNRAVQHVESQIPDNINLFLDVPDDIEAYVGPPRIERALINLITNAVHAMKDGGHITIKAYKQKDGSGFFFQVIDTGEGIPKEIIPKIFDPFFTTKHVGQGSGLGLSIVYGIIEQHGGKITVASEVGKGTVFKCFLPFGQPDSEG
jgi:signal transduction histidine kinase